MVNWESCNFSATKENLQFLNLREGGAGSYICFLLLIFGLGDSVMWYIYPRDANSPQNQLEFVRFNFSWFLILPKKKLVGQFEFVGECLLAKWPGVGPQLDCGGLSLPKPWHSEWGPKPGLRSADHHEREREPPTPASRNHEAAAALSQQYRVSVEGLMTRWTAHWQKYVKVGEHLDPRSWVEASRTRSASTRSKAFKANWGQLSESIHWLCLTSDFV